MQTLPEQFEAWLKAPSEDEHLEFKEAKTQYSLEKTYKYCVALANEGGGKFILGVSDKCPRTVVGTSAFPNRLDLVEKIYQKLRFRVDVEDYKHSGGRVLILHVPGRPAGMAHELDGAYWMRSAGNLVAMTYDQLRRVFSEGQPDWLAQNAMEDCKADDVIRLLDTQAYFDLMNKPYPSTREGVIDRMCSENIVRKSNDAWVISNLGAMTFAKNLEEFNGLSRKAPRVIVYDGIDKLRTNLDKTGLKGYAVGFEGLVSFVTNLIPANEVVTKAIRQEVKMFPDNAIRELIANALIHQTFDEYGSSVKIEIYSDRIEISNPGHPPISTDRFIDENKSRNEALADLMRRLGICEEKGSGIDRVVAGVEAFQLPAPDFREGSVHTSAVLFSHKEFADMDREDRIRACYQHCALKYVMNQQMTNQSLRHRFNLSSKRSEAVSRVLRDSIAAGRIKLSDPSVKSVKSRRYIPWWA